MPPTQMQSMLLNRSAGFGLSDLHLQNLKINIVGLGAIGSWVATTLGRLGFQHLTLIDPDGVEANNIFAQTFIPAHVGTPKANAIRDSIVSIQGTTGVIGNQPGASVRRLNRDDFFYPDILFLCVDNLWTRRFVADVLPHSSRAHAYQPLLLIDTRMAHSSWQLVTCHTVPGPSAARFNEGFAFDPRADLSRGYRTYTELTDYYRSTIPAPDAVEDAPCGTNTTPQAAMSIAALSVAQLCRVLKGQPYYRRIIDSFVTLERSLLDPTAGDSEVLPPFPLPSPPTTPTAQPTPQVQPLPAHMINELRAVEST